MGKRAGLGLVMGFVMLGALGILAGAAEPGASSERPNLVVITFDTTRADRTSVYGYEAARTKGLERLAREGVTFTRAYTQSTQTLPSHVSLFTGLYPITHNVMSNGQKLSDEALTLAEVLRARGYQTAAFVSTAPLMKAFHMDQGFETYNDKLTHRPLDRAAKSLFRVLSFKKINIRAVRPANRVNGAGMRWLERASRSPEPFFLWVHFIDPHYPYEYRPSFDDPQRVVQEGSLNRYGYQEQNYVNEIEFADYCMNKLLEKLDALDLTRRTVTVVAADHGESLGEHGFQGHRQEVYENIIHVPLIVRFPGHLEGGKRLSTPVMLIDVMPTVLKLLKIPFMPGSFQGDDVFEIPEEQPRKLFSQAVKLFTKEPIRTAVIWGDLKYIEQEDSHARALYDLRSDPEETRNLLSTDSPLRTALDWASEVRGWRGRYEKLSFSDFKMSPDQLEALESLGYAQ